MKYCLISAILLLAACASAYGDKSVFGGVNASWLSNTILMVDAKGNGFTSTQRIIEYTMLKAAEKTIEAGYRYMVITDSVDTSSTMNYVVPGDSRTEFRANVDTIYPDYPYYSNQYSSNMIISGQATKHQEPDLIIPIVRPGQRLMFIVSKQTPEGLGRGQYLDAYDTYNSLGPKYIKDFEPIIYQSLDMWASCYFSENCIK